MRIINRRINELMASELKIGFAGENEHTRVMLDCADVFAQYPHSVPAVTVQPADGLAYPAIVRRDGDTVIWDVTDSDLAAAGHGEIQVTFTENGVVCKSCIGRILVRRSIEPTGEAPDPVEDWLVAANTALNAIPQTIDDALEAAKESGEFDGEPGAPGDPGADGFSPVITVTDITGGHRVTITDATGSRTVDIMDGEPGAPGNPGSPGADGVSPTVAVSSITDGHRVTITDKTGAHSFDIMDGVDGDPGDPGHSPVLTSSKSGKVTTIYSDGAQLAQISDGEDGTTVIDDSAGSGDTDKVWSADKTAGEVSDLNSALNANYLSTYFELADGSIDSDNEEKYIKRLGAIHYIALYGFTTYSKYRLNLVARNHSTNHYRIIIYGYNGTTWVSAFDTGSDFTVTENANGDTLVTKTIGTQTIVMLINYNQMMDTGVSYNINNNRYNFTENVFAFHISDYATKDEVNRNKANILGRYFVLENASYNSDKTELYFQRLGAIHHIELIGFEIYQKCRLRLIARNNSSFKYRFIIAGYNGTTWADVFDSGSDFTVTENTDGDTFVSKKIGSLTVNMFINYNEMMPTGTSWNESTPTGNYRYIFSDNVYKTENEYAEPLMYANYQGNDNVSIKYKYKSGENRIINFSDIGVNNLFQPHYIYKEEATELTKNFSGLTLIKTYGTDLVSPYHGLIANDPSVTEGITVGGNHGTNGSSGFPTSSRVSLKVYADGVEISQGDLVGCSEVKMVLKTNIAASNTINLETGAFDPAMLETVVWTVTPYNMEVCVYLKALTNISIKGYVGLQLPASSMEYALFNDGNTKKAINGTYISSANYPSFEGYITLLANDTLDEVNAVYTNRGVGLGDLSHIGNGYPVAYISANNKLYQHLVNVPVDLNSGETACYSGGYTFMDSFECTGAYMAYFIELNGGKIYCVDFNSSGTAYVDMPIETIGKEITIVEESEGITIDSIISGNGIRVESTGVGYARFKVK